MSLSRNEKVFFKDLEVLINKYSLENDSNAPDFILADYLVECLKEFNKRTRQREAWYGKSLRIGMKDEA